MSGIFGGSKQKQSSTNKSWNEAYPQISSTYGGTMQTGVNAGQMASDALMGGQGAADAFGSFKKSIGYDQLMKDAMGAVSGKFGALGAGNSGAALKEAQRSASQLGQNTFGNWLQNLFGVQDRGQQAAGLVVNAGQRSEGTSSGSSSSKPGIGGFLGGLGSAIAASDIRLKKNIKFIKKLANGLNLYQYDYINNSGPHIGVMAQEVEKVMPEALGPVIDGYMTVDYSKIEGVRDYGN